MKIAVMKGGTNITFSSGNKSAANADILYALRTIDPTTHQCTCVTHRTRNTYIPKPLKFEELLDIKSLDKFDVILLFNFSINFFGGKEDPNLIKTYKLLAKTHTPIVYVNTDGQLMFKQLWPSIKNRDWAANYCEEDFYIDPAKVMYVTQGRNKSKMLKMLNTKPDFIIPKYLHHFPWERTILANYEKHFMKLKNVSWSERPYDLVFGGATRNTHKRKRIENYYKGTRLHTLLFGNLRGVSTGIADVHPKVSYQEFIRKMQSGKATVTVGDLNYNDNFFTLRMYESILAGNLVFIDEQMDTKHSFYNGIAASTNQLYVNNVMDIVNIFNIASDDELSVFTAEIRREILNRYDLHSENKRLINHLSSAASIRD